MIIEPDKVATFGNTQLTASIDLSAPMSAVVAIIPPAGCLGEADTHASFLTGLAAAGNDVQALVADLVATLAVDGEALLLVAAQNEAANTGGPAGGDPGDA